ncbi:MAG: DsrE family protein [Bacteroidota bacterium]
MNHIVATISRSLLAIAVCLPILILGQGKKAGPVIQSFGKVWPVPQQDYHINTADTLKVVFDITKSPENVQQLNKSIETAARFLNMHAQNGVPQDHMKVALVIHDPASKDISTAEAYKTRYGVANPNEDLVKALLKADATFIFCGQSSLSRNLPMDGIIPGVQLSLSAMTALIQLQNEGYQLIKF